MPFEVRQRGEYWVLFKIKEGVYAKSKFRSKAAAVNQAKNWMRWRFEDPVIKGNVIKARKRN